MVGILWRGGQRLGLTQLASELWTPVLTQIRLNHNRPNLQRPLPFHYKKVRLIELVKPEYPPIIYVCSKLQTSRNEKNTTLENHGYGLFLAREMRRMFETHPMVALFHTNSYTEHEFLKVRGMLFDSKFPMDVQNKINSAVANKALRGTKFEPALKLLGSKSAFGYCREADTSKLLKALKKMPHHILLGLIYEDRLLHRADFERLAKLPDITTLRSQLCNTLSLASTGVPNLLQAHQIELTQNLELHSKGSK